MLPRFRSLFIFVAILALIAAAGLLAYGRFSAPLGEAAVAIRDGDAERALRAYATSAERFRDVKPVQQLLPAEFALVAHNQLALLYRLGRYDDVIELAAEAPQAAAPHFWAGCALFKKSAQETKPESQLEQLTRAEDEFKLALVDAPDDWDTKFNYELSARIAAAMRNQPKGKHMQGAPASTMQLLRQQATPPQQRLVKKVG